MDFIARGKCRSALIRITSASLLLLTGAAQADDLVAQYPLHVRDNLPGNLALVPSVEFPTINSVANLGGYNQSSTYAGYFDSGKCYQYHYASNEAERHFFPVHTTGNHRCTDLDAPWSGNFLNWAATQTIDPFRKALTGGYRVHDTTTETWLEKARQDGQGGNTYYPDRRIPASGNNQSLLNGATPFNVNNHLYLRIAGLGNKMRLRVGDSNVNDTVRPFGSSSSNATCQRTLSRGGGWTGNSCEFSIRVKVCVSGLEESNCQPYANASKPEGTLQQYAKKMRYAAFGYLNDHSANRDGGVLRARMKYIGPEMPTDDPDSPWVDNPNKEWNPNTGQLLNNPDPADATRTPTNPSIQYSGVINYINRFGQMTDKNHKNHDPVSELYYSALRYYRGLSNVPAYSNLGGDSFDQTDGFPVITDWDDPVENWCQSNVILGIGDIYTHRDKNLPGSNCSANEPGKPSEVSGDTDVNVVTATNAIGAMEGLGNLASCNFTGRDNSAFMAGLAWDARSRDIRPDLDEGRTTVSTYWVDVLEEQSLEGMHRNQFALTAKYGGARLPVDFDAAEWGTQPLPESWWHSNGETLIPFGRGAGHASFKRPDNFFVAGEAGAMVDSLTQAFASVASSFSGSGASLGTNSTRLDVGARTYQGKFTSGTWHGELNAHSIDQTTGNLIEPPLWSAVNEFPNWSERKIYFHDPSGNNSGQRFKLFSHGNLNASQRSALGNSSQEIVDYLRGKRENEQPNGVLRTRTSILGDIVNSPPVYVGQPIPRLYATAQFSGANQYAAFVNAQAGRDAVIYVGANDGMLHGFRADTGEETFAYVPNAVITPELASYASPDYEHRFFVDGEITVADVYDTSQSGNWKTVLVGTLGRGGAGIFALDITDPHNVKFLWEKSTSDTGLASLGSTIGTPVIAQVADGDWRVILGNGLDSANGDAALVMISLFGGNAESISTGVPSNNALTSVYTLDSDADGFIDTAYAGDLNGNLWRFTDLATTPHVTKLFQAIGPDSREQPITTAPIVARDPDTGDRWVFFGTGQYLNALDRSNIAIQSWYGLIDSGSIEMGPIIPNRNALQKREILAEGEISGTRVRVIEAAENNDMLNKSGWFIDLVSPVDGAIGERIVVPNLMVGRELIGTSRTPDASDICRPSGGSFIMAINPFTGARINRTFFDITLDGVFDSGDQFEVDGELVDVSGIGTSSGANTPVFVGDLMLANLDDGSVPPWWVNLLGAEARRTSWRELIGE